MSPAPAVPPMTDAISGLDAPWPRAADAAGLLASLPPDKAEVVRALLLERERLLERYRSVVETATDAIVITDPERRIAFGNPAAHALFGMSGEQLVGTPAAQLVPPEAREAIAAHEAAALAGEPQRYETVVLRASGERRTVSVSTAMLRDGETVVGIVAALRDITEERLLLHQLHHNEKLAAVGQLVSGVAHELNNPLAGVMAFAQLLQATAELPRDQADAVETILKEAKRAARIVANLLLFARQRNAERGPTDLNAVMRDTLELRRYVLHTEQVEVVTDLDPDLPLIRADAFQLQQVVLNLLTNAEQALRAVPGPKRITLRTRRAGDRAIASVADTGPGIPTEQLDRIFNPFFTTKPVGEGTGLGLSIADGIVRQHGGRLAVQSVPGQGATFSIELPLLDLPKVATNVPSQAAAIDPRGHAFLLVEDEPAIRVALSRFLKREGHAVDAVAGGAEALALLQARQYGAILLDLRMPEMSGEEVFRTLRVTDPEHAGRVVFATGDVESDGARDFLRAAQRPYVSKPFVLTTVAHLLCSVAERRRA